jgi:2-phospho-L-lactate/phosphoenolpyruvate guanylyltransferase
MRVIAVPVKTLERAKSRLAQVLTPLERGALTLAMLEDVLDATLAMAGWQTWVVSPDESVLEVSARRRARPVVEEKAGLTTAIRQVQEDAASADALAVVLGDLPLLTAESLGRVLRTLGPVVAAPSGSEDGTNVLLRRPPTVIPPRFGADSFRKHRAAADLKELPFAVVHAPELAFDLDTPDDIAQLLEWRLSSRTRESCLDMGLAERLNLRTP